MPVWGTVVLSIGTLVLGGILTMIAQARTDRRAGEREQLDRRQEFLAKNFDLHRPAMLDMQELVQNLFAAYRAERRRRDTDGFYKYMKDFPIRDSFQRVISRTGLMFEGLDAYTNASTKAERKALEEAFTKELSESRKALQALDKDFDGMSAAMESLYPFWRELARFSTEMRLCMNRSGSNSVIYSGDAFIYAVLKWTEYYQRNENETALADKVEDAYSGANRALSNALTFGPYDKYDAPKTTDVDWSAETQTSAKMRDLIAEFTDSLAKWNRKPGDDDKQAAAHNDADDVAEE